MKSLIKQLNCHLKFKKMIALHHVDKQCVTYILKNTHHIIFDKVSKSNVKKLLFLFDNFSEDRENL